MSYDVTIRGFATKDTAIAFMDWYAGQGEQDIGIWLDERKREGWDIIGDCYTKSIDNDNLEMQI